MNDKPSYLGLLNAISIAESAAEEYLCCWAQTTPRDDVRQVISTVALREGEHGKAFAKRMCELGYGVIAKEDPKRAERLEIAASTTLSDRQKFECLELGRPETDGDDVFASMLRDKTIDIQTGALLGRYIAEERDSGRLLRGCYQALCAEETSGSTTAAIDADLGARLSMIEERLDKIMARLDLC